MSKERQPLSAKAKAFLVLGLLLVAALVPVSVVAALDRQRRSATDRALESVREVARGLVTVSWHGWYGADRPGGAYYALRSADKDDRVHAIATPPSAADEPARILCDGWGTPVRVQIKGPVHKDGYDVWSCGPNKLDEQGLGDDVLIGESKAELSKP